MSAYLVMGNIPVYGKIFRTEIDISSARGLSKPSASKSFCKLLTVGKSFRIVLLSAKATILLSQFKVPHVQGGIFPFRWHPPCRYAFYIMMHADGEFISRLIPFGKMCTVSLVTSG